ncbi:MAG: hypothetical protein JWM82_1363 [Myxococcales bacterium]|nr:hypothetical protein [Myxococcales bacterium]
MMNLPCVVRWSCRVLLVTALAAAGGCSSDSGASLKPTTGVADASNGERPSPDAVATEVATDASQVVADAGADAASCSGTTSAMALGGGAECKVATPSAPPMPSGNQQPLDAYAQAEGLIELDRVLGRLLRGDVVVYGGSITARDNQYAHNGFPDPPDVTMTADGTAIAVLSDGELDVASLCEGKVVLFRKGVAEPGETFVSSIGDDGVLKTPMAGCSSCFPGLSPFPTTIAWTAAAFSDSYSLGNTSMDFEATSSGHLDRLAPCRLTWPQLVVAESLIDGGVLGRGDLSQFVREGNEMVMHFSGARNISATGRTCDGRSDPFTIDLVVDVANFGDYRVRNFVAGPSRPICGA